MRSVMTVFTTLFLLGHAAPTVSALAPDNTEAPWDQWTTAQPTWVEQIEPFRVIGPIYFVGTKGLSSFLIASDQGHIVIDAGLPQNADQIAGNIETLGFRVEDVRILLNSHAHFDHSGGLQRLKALSGAKLYASEEDRSALEGGFYLGSEDNIAYSAPPVVVDRVIRDGQTITLGGNNLTASLTPGHTRGCTSWRTTIEEQGKPYDVLFFCGASVAANSLIPPQYEGIVADYQHTFEKTRDWKPDVLLVNHPFFFDMDAKRAKQLEGDPLAFIGRADFPALRQQLEAGFMQSLDQATQKQKAPD